MRFDLIVRYDDGTRQSAAKSFDDLGVACREALDLADRLGRDAVSGGPVPRYVECHESGRLEIAVSVVSGGLSPDRAANPE
jgi:hypothetical protein